MAAVPDLEISLLRTFLAVSETRGFTAAADRLHLVQSAVSMQIRRLEALVGQPLFVRTHRPISLTPAGALLAGHAREILRLNERAISDLNQSALQGAVRLGTLDIYATFFLPGILKAFAQENPGVALEVRCESTWNLMKALEGGELDLVLATRQEEFPAGRVVLREPLAWVAANGSRLHDERPLPLALLAHDCACRTAALQALETAAREWKIVYSSQSYSGIIAVATAGLAVTVLPRFLIGAGLRALGEREGFGALPQSDIAIYGGPHAPSSPAAVFAQAIANCLGHGVPQLGAPHSLRSRAAGGAGFPHLLGRGGGRPVS